jgi:membrane protease YdiL (CAAX protease family)
MNEDPHPATNPYAAPGSTNDFVQAELVSEPQWCAPPPPSGIAAFFLDETRRLRTVWRFLIFIFGFIVAQVAAATVLVICVAIYFLVTRGAVDPEELQQVAETPTSWMFALSTVPQFVASVLVVVVCRLALDRRSLKSIGLVAPSQRWNRSWLLAFAFGAAPILISFALVVASGGFRLDGYSFTWGAAVLTPVLVLAAFHEEIVFRGYLVQNMLDIKRPIAGVVVSSLLFWIVHGLNPAAWQSPLVGVNLFLAGILLSLAYMLSRDLWFPTIMHFAWNFTQGIVLDIPISGIDSPGVVQIDVAKGAPDWLTGGEFGLEGSAVTTVVQVVVAGLLGALVMRAGAKPKANGKWKMENGK